MLQVVYTKNNYLLEYSTFLLLLFLEQDKDVVLLPKVGEISKSPGLKLRFWRETDLFPNGYFGYRHLRSVAYPLILLDNEDIDIPL